VASGAEINRLDIPTNGVNSIVFNAAGSHLLISNVDGSVGVWDVQSKELTLHMVGHTYPSWSAVYSPDEKLIASGSADKTIVLWDSTTGKELERLHGHTEDVYSLAFTRDGTLLLSGSNDKTIRVWGLGVADSVWQACSQTWREREQVDVQRQREDEQRQREQQERQRLFWRATGRCEVSGEPLSLLDRMFAQTVSRKHRKGKRR
jgi:hypothetical protein